MTAPSTHARAATDRHYSQRGFLPCQIELQGLHSADQQANLHGVPPAAILLQPGLKHRGCHYKKELRRPAYHAVQSIAVRGEHE